MIKLNNRPAIPLSTPVNAQRNKVEDHVVNFLKITQPVPQTGVFLH